MMLPPVTFEYLLMVVATGVGTCVAVYMAARHNRRQEFAFQENEQEGTMDGTQLTFDEAIEQRNAVMDSVADKNVGWLKEAVAIMRQIPDGTEVTGERLRLLLLERGLREPAHPGAWGALTGTLARKRMLVATGQWEPMRQKSSHGRLTRCYRKHTPESEAA